MATKLTNEEHREAGFSHLDYMRELLKRDGDKAALYLHAAHMRSLLAAASPEKR
ncbi:hypothetical protein [Bradyrhizobium uaiense]|uniref:hypothetical protein n=1 Tax=Bradyrhizobium uaiense TaxID=2594946 RepID=UPI0013EF4207|nr:hypothetical protein [Bradyrhizobium uaiense]